MGIRIKELPEDVNISLEDYIAFDNADQTRKATVKTLANYFLMTDALASSYDIESEYKAGQYVIHNGLLYRAKKDISAGSMWNEEDWETIDLMSVTSGLQLTEQCVETIYLKDGCVTHIKLATDSVNTDNIVDASISKEKLQDNSVTTEKIVDSAITVNKLADNSVSTSAIINDAVTAEKIKEGAIQSDHLSNNSVTADKIANKSITSDKLADNVLSGENISDKTISMSKLTDDIVDKINTAPDLSSKIDTPLDDDGVKTYGKSGEILITNGDGTTAWSNVGSDAPIIMGTQVTGDVAAAKWTNTYSVTLTDPGTYLVFYNFSTSKSISNLTAPVECTVALSSGVSNSANEEASQQMKRQSMYVLDDGHYYSCSICAPVTVTATTTISGQVWCKIALKAYYQGMMAVKLGNTYPSFYGHYIPDTFVKGIGHRGYAFSAPENTLPAFKLARKMGFEYVEADVQFTSDGNAVLLHDATIDRTSTGTGRIDSMTLATARTYDFGVKKGLMYTGVTIPTLQEFFLLCRNIGLKPYVEIKYDSKTTYTQTQMNALVDLARQYGMSDKITWISFGLNYLTMIKNYDQTARLGYLTGQTINNDLIAQLNTLKTGKNEVFLDSSYSYATAEGAILCAKNNIPLEVWTVDDEKTIKNLHPYVTGVTSNRCRPATILYKENM